MNHHASHPDDPSRIRGRAAKAAVCASRIKAAGSLSLQGVNWAKWRRNSSILAIALSTGLVAAKFTGSIAAVLDRYTFGTNPATSVLTPDPTGVDPNVIASPITGDTGIVLDLSNPATRPPSAPYLRTTMTVTGATPAAAVANHAGFKFTLTAAAGNVLDLTSLNLDAMKGGASSPRGFDVRSSADNFGADIFSSDVTGVRPALTTFTIDLSGAAYQNLSTITFEIYSYSNAAASSVEYDNIIVNGSALLITGPTVTWNGNVNGTWDTVTANWTGATSTYADTDKAIFDDTATGTTNVVIQASGVSPGGVIFNNSAKDYTLSNASGSIGITGLTSIVKNGTGTVTLSSPNSYTGGTVINAGTLSISNDNALGAVPISVKPANITLNGGTLKVTQGTTANAGLGSETINTNRGITLSSNSTLDIRPITFAAAGPQLGSETALVYSGVITGAGGLTILGSGGAQAPNANLDPQSIVDLGAASTYAGVTTINNAVVQVNPATSIVVNVLPVTTTLNLVNKGMFNISLDGANQTVAGLTGDATGSLGNTNQFSVTTLTLNGSGNYNFPGTIGAAQVAGQIGSDAALNVVKSGTGTQTLSGTNTYGGTNPGEGGTTLNSGTLNLNSASAIGLGTLTINGGTLDTTAADTTISTGNTQVWAGDFAFTGTHNLNLGIGAVTLSANRQVTVNGGILTVGGGISGDTFTLTKAGNGTLALAGLNTYTGNTIVNAGKLALVNSTSTNNISTSPTISIAAGATLDTTGLSGAGLTLVAGQNLNGVGTVNGGLKVISGSSISPGVGVPSFTETIGTLSVGNLTLLSGSQVNFVLGTPGGSLATPGAGSMIAVTGNVTLPATGIVFNPIDNANAGGLGALGFGFYELISYTGTVTGFTASSFKAPGDATYTFTNQNHQIDLQISAPTIPTLTWTGQVNGTGAPNSKWQFTPVLNNWANGSAPAAYSQGNIVSFGDLNAANGNAPITNTVVVIQAGGVNPGSVTFNNNVLNYTLNDVAGDTVGIAGNTGINVNGTGTVFLQSPNSFTGPVKINSGAINFSDPGAFGTTSGVIVASGGALQIQGSITTAASLALSINGVGLAATPAGALNNVSGLNVFSGPITLATSSTIGVSAGSLTLAGIISGNGSSLTVSGPGTLILGASNTFTGTTTANNGGIVSVSADNNLGPAPATPTAGLLNLEGGGLSASANLTLSPNRGIAVGNLGGTLDVAAGATLTYAGTIANITGESGSLTKTGNGILALTTANTYTNGTNVNGGSVKLTNTAAAGPGAIFVNGGVLDLGAAVPNAINLNAGSTLGVTGTQTLPGNITVAGNATIDTYDAITGTVNVDLITTGMLVGTGNVTVQNQQGTGPDGTGWRLRGPVATGANAFSGTITLLNSTKFEIQSVAGQTTGSQAGTGTIIMVGGTFNGTTQGTFSLMNLRNNSSAALTLGNNVQITGNAGTFALINLVAPNVGTVPAGTPVNMGSLTIGDQGVGVGATNGVVSQSLRFTSVALTGTNASFDPTPPTEPSYNTAETLSLGAIGDSTSTNSAGSGISMVGTGTLILTATNGYRGATTLNSGTTLLGAVGALPSATALTVSSTGANTAPTTLNFNNGGTSNDQTVASLAGTLSGVTTATATITNSDAANTRTLTVAQSGVNTSFAGAITGNLNVVKSGNGTLQLTGANTFTGSTSVTGGTLSVGSDSVHGSVTSAVTVGAGGTFAGTGSSGAVTVQGGGTLAPGNFGDIFNGAGILTANGGLDLSAPSALFALDLGGTSNSSSTLYDQVSVTSGSVTLGGNIQVSLTNFGVYSPTVGDTFYVILNDAAGASPINGMFGNAPVSGSVSNSTGTITDSAGDILIVSYTANALTGGQSGFTPGQGQDVALQVFAVVPEPGSLMAFTSGMGLLLGLGRFRRRA